MTRSSSGLRSLRSQVIARARWRCEYCTAPQAGSAYSFHLDHILPRARGGPTVFENLALACAPCNGAKREKINATDPRTREIVRLFNPRIDHWEDHFRWDASRIRIVGRTTIGRATSTALHFNDPLQQEARRFWRLVGLL
jgi:5-methylcytosine-specific restriction endonuclease McrA